MLHEAVSSARDEIGLLRHRGPVRRPVSSHLWNPVELRSRGAHLGSHLATNSEIGNAWNHRRWLQRPRSFQRIDHPYPVDAAHFDHRLRDDSSNDYPRFDNVVVQLEADGIGTLRGTDTDHWPDVPRLVEPVFVAGLASNGRTLFAISIGAGHVRHGNVHIRRFPVWPDLAGIGIRLLCIAARAISAAEGRCGMDLRMLLRTPK